MTTAPNWDPRQYLRHAGHRTRPFQDLLARVPELPTGSGPGPGRPPRIADLGCGPGNVTVLLFDRWPDAHVTGLDNSAEMLAEAQPLAGPTTGGGRLDLRRTDVRDWAPDEPYDLIVSNAALQWIPGHPDSFGTWLAGLRPGGTFAFQVPGNFTAPSHTLLRDLCDAPEWRDRLADRLRDPASVLEPTEYLERLAALGCEVDAWETTYVQVLTGPDPVLDWVKGTALRPVLTALADDPPARDRFLAAYAALLRDAYPSGPHGTAFPFRRIFVVARGAQR
ncbi:trans-aconitate 2-methyltransferase [Streptomyces melanosporofaciens]|uniref:Trans-aconitate 2-methyltransferase n=1 Tax=Streptomyces melanosporofaciens TaxID=67327 RepID=A0A1H4SWL8_STRMJ|nr:trans-aconitate 2-methyltransferase [Streptomyces melanosporofaciens]SEC48458.1 trans-aconitate 2-methyltransferase [Streptomyces melanosporofaciens]